MIAACRPILLYRSSYPFEQVLQHFKAKPGIGRSFVNQSKMTEAKEFPPQKVRAIVAEVAALLKEKKESVSVAETVCFPVQDSALVICYLDSRFACSSKRRASAHFLVNTGRPAYKVQAAGGIISASILSTPGASGIYKGGLNVRPLYPASSTSLPA